MITSTIIIAVLGVVIVLLSFLPPVTSLPFGIDGVFYTVGHWIVLIQADFWPLGIVFKMFFLFYLPLLVALLVLKLVLGHRAPGHHNTK